ncbi:MAG TPA: Na+ dependent nucleoside transporter, partial [Marinilabiliaceae bacterium]|nr:Na+ dependent nucleoside transporter [Marinilabiliaceae bacterium]
MAGGVLAVYIKVLGGGDPVQEIMYAKHLLAASLMAAPGVVVIAKIMLPQTEAIQKEVEVSKDRIGKNVLDAISNGTTEGVKLAVNVAGMLFVFIT